METTFPKISVVIPVYNGEPFINEAINSVFAQNISAIEIIVIDDCSTDKTLEKLSEFGNKITILTNINNSGASFSRNQGIKHASGDYIAFLDADDIWFPHKLKLQLKVLSEHPDSEFIYTQSKLVNIEDYDNEKVLICNYDDKVKFQKKSLLEVFNNPYFSTSTILISKALCESIGYFREDLRTAEDIDFCLKAASNTSVMALQNTLAITRRVENSLGDSSSSYQDNLKVLDEFLQTEQDFALTNDKSISMIKRKIYDDYLRELLFQKSYSIALSIGFKSCYSCPLTFDTLKLLCKTLTLFSVKLLMDFFSNKPSKNN